MTFFIQQLVRRKAGPWLNSPTIETWQDVGHIKGESPHEALFWAMGKTGATVSDLRIVGVHVGPEK